MTRRRFHRHLPVLLCLIAFSARAATVVDPGVGLRALILEDQQSAKTSPDRWPDLRAASLRGREALDRAELGKVHAIARGRLTADDRVLYDLFEWQLQRRLEEFRLRLYVTPFWSDERYVGNAGVLGLATSFPLATQRGKILAFPEFVNQVTALLREGMREKMLPSAALVRPIAGSCVSITSGNYSDDAAVTSARKAAKDFCSFVTNEYLPACPHSRSLSEWPNGSEVYGELARRYTTTGLAPERIHEFGVAEVERIRRAMLPVIARTGFKGSLDEFLTFARTDPRFYFTNSDDLLRAYRAAVARIEPLVPKVVGHIPATPLRVEAYKNPGGPAAMWRAPGPGRPEGTVMVSVDDPGIHPKFEIVPLMLHEGTPGHHLQHAVAYELAGGHDDAVSAFQRDAGQNPAFAEGWALYAEGLGREMGLYTDPYDEFGELRMELTRAVRVVVDTGIHQYGWSVRAAEQYFAMETGKPGAEIDSEVSRTVWPGGQLAYKVGQERILHMREITSAALGSQFDLRRFHDAILRWGPLPLEILERRLEECLKEQACAAELKKR